MCGIFCLSSPNKDRYQQLLSDFDIIFKYLRKRGPDAHNIIKDGDLVLIHFLLSISGYRVQPVVGRGKLCWNGEIYNKPESFESDTDFLLSYLDSLDEITSQDLLKLDGEYVIVYVREDKLHLITDTFATKPCCFYLGQDTLAISNYDSPIHSLLGNVETTRVKANTHYIFDLVRYQKIAENTIYEWDFIPRYNTYDRWLTSFQKAVAKRVKTDKNLFVPLSSGYDSGSLTAELIKTGKKFTAYTFKANEDVNVMKKRINLIRSSGNIHYYTDTVKNFNVHYVNYLDNVEKFVDHNRDFGRDIRSDLTTNKTAVALYMVARQARNDNNIIWISGQGVDEIYSDYMFSNNSTIKGNYTNVRKKWPNFDGGFNQIILNITERIGGSVGIETRYPFLDRELTQEFLWLDDTLKNRCYKQCIRYYLDKERFPYIAKKIGLCCFPVKNNDYKATYKQFVKKIKHLSKQFYLTKKVVIITDEEHKDICSRQLLCNKYIVVTNNPSKQDIDRIKKIYKVDFVFIANNKMATDNYFIYKAIKLKG